MIISGTRRLIIRDWKDDDRALFHEINSDPQVMEFFPMRRDRQESDALLERINDMIHATGFGFYALEHRETGKPMGFCGISPVTVDGVFPPGTMEIGWRLAAPYWGQGFVTEAAKALLSMSFDEKQLSEIVSFAVHDNHRSTAVMKRIGLIRDPSRDFDHPRVPDTHPQLKPHVTYALSNEQWKAMHKHPPV
ncbi:GNAT family N-acetyltransferase [Agrobacterium larrymoorei]|uniref:GNAT family N-acetyltransferase n=1 Tax=Agrobacterium larrymoorei TaxID=160699 RepID=A0AAF0H9T4_9HYPH|nr:GNAT family N-acetyltransferase [Agrobacterium larrymoorei]WHA42188.1 GNAT family N-acetyltransferase [Agrobacterium larrymoorei]